MTREAPRPLRVLMTADAVGGVWPYALSLARALGPRAEILLAVMGPAPSDAQQRQAALIPGLRLATGPYRLEWMAGAEADLPEATRWLRGLAANFAPELVHINGYAAAAEDWAVPVLLVAHSCVLSWWHAVHGTAAPAEWSGYAGRVALGLARAARIVAPTGAMLQSLALHYGLERRGAVIANGCDLRAPGARVKEKRVLAAGRLWDDGKNLAALDRVAERLPWPVEVAGETRHPDGRAAAPRVARPLGVLTPEALAERMAGTAVYALPARYEPFGLSVLEAATLGCALVLGDIPSMRELWQDAAIFVPPEDISTLTRAIAELLGEDDKCQAIAAAAQRRARRFSAASMADRYLSLYAEIAPPAFARRSPMLAEAG